MQQIEELNGKIRELVEQESPRFVCGKLLYDEIRKDGTLQLVERQLQMLHRLLQSHRLRRLQPPPEENQPKTAHNAFFLILYEMGLEDKDVRRIMGITQEAIRSTRYRIVQNTKRILFFWQKCRLIYDFAIVEWYLSRSHQLLYGLKPLYDNMSCIILII